MALNFRLQWKHIELMHPILFTLLLVLWVQKSLNNNNRSIWNYLLVLDRYLKSRRWGHWCWHFNPWSYIFSISCTSLWKTTCNREYRLCHRVESASTIRCTSKLMLCLSPENKSNFIEHLLITNVFLNCLIYRHNFQS